MAALAVVAVGKILRLGQEVLVILLHNLHLKEIMEEVGQLRAAQQAVAVAVQVPLVLIVLIHRLAVTEAQEVLHLFLALL
jgi:hypothetical protein